jgi:streptogramin lyase
MARVLILSVVMLALAGAAQSASPRFSAQVTNAWFPLAPGSRYVYTGITQDAQGNVWYYGEDTATLDHRGRATGTSGTWRAGVAGAQPGIYMPALRLYVRGIGIVLEQAQRGGNERNELVSFSRS